MLIASKFKVKNYNFICLRHNAALCHECPVLRRSKNASHAISNICFRKLKNLLFVEAYRYASRIFNLKDRKQHILHNSHFIGFDNDYWCTIFESKYGFFHFGQQKVCKKHSLGKIFSIIYHLFQVN